MSELKESAKSLLNAAGKFGKALIQETSELADQHIKPKVEQVTDKIQFEQTKKEIKKHKVKDIKQDASRRKYHRGG